MMHFPENNVRAHMLQALQHPSLAVFAQSAALTHIILLGDKKGTTEIFGCHCAAV